MVTRSQACGHRVIRSASIVGPDGTLRQRRRPSDRTWPCLTCHSAGVNVPETETGLPITVLPAGGVKSKVEKSTGPVDSRQVHRAEPQNTRALPDLPYKSIARGDPHQPIQSRRTIRSRVDNSQVPGQPTHHRIFIIYQGPAEVGRDNQL